MELSRTAFETLDNLARARWGMQGAGICNNSDVFVELVRSGLARPIIGEPKRILVVTLRGFRLLEERRHRRKPIHEEHIHDAKTTGAQD